MWQDWAIMAVQIVFALSLLPTILHPTQKPTFSTAILTVLCLLLMGITYLSLSLWFATFFAGVNVALWMVLAFQRYRLNRKAANFH